MLSCVGMLKLESWLSQVDQDTPCIDIKPPENFKSEVQQRQFMEEVLEENCDEISETFFQCSWEIQCTLANEIHCNNFNSGPKSCQN